MRLFNVIGMEDTEMEGLVFARCTTYEKALKVKEILETKEGFEDMVDIVQDLSPVDVFMIGGRIIEI